MLKFDEMTLVSELRRLPASLRVAFAAACAERQMPAYRLFHAQTGRGDPEALERALEDVWSGPTPDKAESELERQIEQIMELIPQDNGMPNSWTEQATYAQDAGMSVAYALRARLSGDAQEAAWSARVAYEALDHFVINRENVDTNIPGEEQRVLSHPLVQAEFARQQRDLDELLCTPSHQVKLTIDRIRDRARAEAPEFLGSVS